MKRPKRTPLERDLLKALKTVKELATYRYGGLDNADPGDMRDDLEGIKETADTALEDARAAQRTT